MNGPEPKSNNGGVTSKTLKSQTAYNFKSAKSQHIMESGGDKGALITKRLSYEPEIVSQEQ